MKSLPSIDELTSTFENIFDTKTIISLPTVQQLVARQLQIQHQMEQDDGGVSREDGVAWITNLSKIITGAELAEQMATTEEPKEDDAPVELTFADNALIDEAAVRRAMVGIYSQIETGKISPAMGAARIKALESIAKTFKGAPVVEVNFNQESDHEAQETIGQLLKDIEGRIYRDGQDNEFLVKELALVYSLPLHEVTKAMKDRRTLIKKTNTVRLK